MATRKTNIRYDDDGIEVKSYLLREEIIEDALKEVEVRKGAEALKKALTDAETLEAEVNAFVERRKRFAKEAGNTGLSLYFYIAKSDAENYIQSKNS